jgi:uncharacterized protein
MKNKLISDVAGARVFVLVYEPGEAFQEPLVSFAAKQHLGAGHFTAIGAFSRATLGYFDRERKDYIKIPVNHQVEVLTLSGNIMKSDSSDPKIHAHVILGQRDGSVHGGHLLEAQVWPTLELILSDSPRHLSRQFDPKIGLALIAI